MKISIFARRAFLNTKPNEEFDFNGERPIGHLKRVSSIIRADQIAEILGAKLNPVKGYKSGICIYLKPELDGNGELNFEGKSNYIDMVDGYYYIPLLRNHPELKAIVVSERDYINLSTENLKNEIYLIPQHHCNFERVVRNRNKIKTIGIIGTKVAFRYIPLELKVGLAQRQIQLLEFSEFFTRQDIIDFYQKIDVQLVWRPYKKRFANPLKIVNAASFGIPTIALDESHFKDLGNCYIGVGRVSQFFSELDLLINHPSRYEAFSKLCIKKSEEYHIENIAKLYKQLP